MPTSSSLKSASFSLSKDRRAPLWNTHFAWPALLHVIWLLFCTAGGTGLTSPRTSDTSCRVVGTPGGYVRTKGVWKGPQMFCLGLRVISPSDRASCFSQCFSGFADSAVIFQEVLVARVHAASWGIGESCNGKRNRRTTADVRRHSVAFPGALPGGGAAPTFPRGPQCRLLGRHYDPSAGLAAVWFLWSLRGRTTLMIFVAYAHSRQSAVPYFKCRCACLLPWCSSFPVDCSHRTN